VYRIGQTRPVTVLKFAMRNTIEDRLLRAREAGAGLFAGQAILPNEADAMAVPAPQEIDVTTSSGPPTSAKMESLRELARFPKPGRGWRQAPRQCIGTGWAAVWRFPWGVL
jgi:hypothetical protein